MADPVRILYVDDEPDLLELAQIFLERSGEFFVTTSTSAKEALESPLIQSCDIVISDYQMPDMDGIAFLKAIRERFGDLPVILFTGRGREEVVIEAINNGVDFYIQKGGDPEAQFAELAHKIRQAALMRRTQMTLAEQEQRYHDLQNANDLIQSVAPDGHFLFVNKKWLDTLGYTEEELPGLTIFDIIHEESLSHCMTTFQQVISGENVGIIDATFRTQKGVKVYVQGMANGKIREGMCQYTRGIFKDVTDRKLAALELVQKNEALNAALEELTATEEELRHHYDLLTEKEQALRESEEKYRDLAELLPQMIFETDPELRITYANRHARTESGLTDQDLECGINALSLIDPSQHADIRANVQKTRKGISFDPKEYTALRKDSSSFPVMIYSNTLFRNNTFAGFRAVVVNISKRKKMEEGILEREEKFRSIFEHSPYPIAITSLPENKFLEVNTAFLDISGYAEEEILGRDPIDLGFLPFTEALKLISRRLLTGTIENVPIVVTAKEGKRVHILFSSIPVTINNKPAVLTVTAEVTKLKRVEEELLRKNKDLIAALEELTATEEELRQNYDELSKKEDVLRESEEKFRVLVELSLDGIIITDFLGKLLFANRTAGLIVDAADYKALIGTRNVMGFVAPESRASVLWDLSQVARGIDTYLVTYKLITETKREVWVECIGKKIQFEGSSAMLVSLRDVTERTRAAEHLKESENKFATVFRCSPVSLTLVSADDGKFIDVNDTFLKSTGYSRDEVVGRISGDIGVFTDTSEYEHFVSTLRKQRTVDGMELRCRIKDGEIRVCRFSSGIIIIDGKPLILSSIKDITERKKNDEALRESEQKFRSLVEHSLDGILILDLQGTILFANTTAARTIEADNPSDWLGRNVMEFIAPESREDALNDFRQIASGHDAYLAQYRIRSMQGNSRWVESIGKVITYEGKPADIVSIRDITERRLAEEALRQANKKLTILSGVTRHDIKNQLITLNGFATLLKREIPDPAYEMYFSRILNASNRIMNMIQFTKEYEAIGVKAPIWQDCHALSETAAKEVSLGDVVVKNDLPAGLEVFADPLIGKVCYNLLDNAVRHGKKITTIRFFAEERDGDRIIVCEDDGVGVAAEEKEQIFKQGFGKNTGMGLFLAREILSITGITITENGEPGTGARFEIVVPEGAYRFTHPSS